MEARAEAEDRVTLVGDERCRKDEAENIGPAVRRVRDHDPPVRVSNEDLRTWYVIEHSPPGQSRRLRRSTAGRGSGPRWYSRPSGAPRRPRPSPRTTPRRHGRGQSWDSSRNGRRELSPGGPKRSG